MEIIGDYAWMWNKQDAVSNTELCGGLSSLPTATKNVKVFWINQSNRIKMLDFISEAQQNATKSHMVNLITIIT